MSSQLGLQMQFCFPFPSSLLSERKRKIGPASWLPFCSNLCHPSAISHPFPCPRDGIRPLEALSSWAWQTVPHNPTPSRTAGWISPQTRSMLLWRWPRRVTRKVGLAASPSHSWAKASPLLHSQPWPLRTQKLSLCEVAQCYVTRLQNLPL